MPRAYYSTTFDLPAEQVWNAVRDFGVYEWAEGVSETQMEDGKPGDAVGGIRSFRYAGEVMRQQLLAHSDLDRSYTFALCDPSPMQNYRAILRVTPITASNGSFVEWWATFDCAPDQAGQFVAFLENDGFPVWLASIPAYLEAGAASLVGVN